MPTFSQGYAPAPAEAINATENRLGVKLPADYKQFLQTTNGGSPHPDCFVVPERGESLIAILYGVRDERIPGDLEYEHELVTLWEPLPAGFVAIGDNPGGCPLLMATLGDDAGRLFFWDRKGFWVRDDGRNLFLVASSFNSFLKSLRE
jgi:hypothetical protein